MTRLSPPEPRTLADAAARWLEGGARPTAPTQGAVRPSLEVARLARRIAGADPLPGRPPVVLCDGHREELAADLQRRLQAWREDTGAAMPTRASGR